MKLCPLCVVAGMAVVGGVAFLTLGGAGNAPQAATAVAAVTAVSNALPSAASFAVDAVHSHVGFKVQHMGAGYTHGRFNDFSGTFSIDPAAPESTSIEIVAKTESVDSNSAGRDKHLRTQDFFSVKEFPEISFKSTSAKAGENGAIAVTGNLTFRGVTKEITVPVKVIGSGKGRGGESIMGFDTEFTINRFDYGVNYGKGALGDNVTLYISIEGAAK
jgi:polyisoprenoid-binding protein YceI